MATLESWADDGLHALPLSRHAFGSRRAGNGALTIRVPLGGGTLGEGLILRVTIPDYFEKISRRRSGWAHPWEEIEKVLIVANDRMATELQLMVVDALQQGRVPGRAWASTGRLEDALLDPRNVKLTGRRFGVGNIGWLNRSQAKYWRQIESGTSVHVGQELIGYWRDSGGSPQRANAARRGHDRLMGGLGVPYEKRERFGRLSKRERDAKRMAELSAKSKIVIRNPIDAQQYFERAWKDFNPRARALATLREAITQVLDIPMKGVSNTWDATIATISK